MRYNTATRLGNRVATGSKITKHGTIPSVRHWRHVQTPHTRVSVCVCVCGFTREIEKVKEDECKQRRKSKFAEAQAELYCKEVGCSFYAQSKAGCESSEAEGQTHNSVADGAPTL